MNQIISVIVPVYNVEQYLKETIESIVNQTYRELEIILVDDGATDTSGRLCDEWAARDARIRVLHKPNQGVSAARNSGLAAATGELVTFADADDLLHPRMYEYLHEALLEAGADVSLCHEKLFYEDTCELNAPDTCRIEKKETTQELLMHFADDWATPINVVWNKLFRKELLDGASFSQCKVGEDMRYMADVLPRVQCAVWVQGELYGYRQRQSSAMQAGSTAVQGLKSLLYQREQCYRTSYTELQRQMDSFVLRKIANECLKEQQAGRHEVVCELRKLYHETYRMIGTSSLSFKDKVIVWLARYCWGGYCLLHR